MALTNEQLVMLDALCYYSELSNYYFPVFDEEKQAYKYKTIENFVLDAGQYTTCFNGILELSDEELGMNAILDWINSDSVLSRLVVVYPGKDYDMTTTASVCLVDPQTNEVYVIFGGNYAQGEYEYNGKEMCTWADNFIGAFVEKTEEQERALDFYKEAISAAKDYLNNNNIDTSNLEITVSGHSAAGNMAQYVTVMYDGPDSISRCVSVDGQGFSQEFIDKHSSEIAANASKITSILPSTSIVGSLMNRLPGIQQIYIDVDCVSSSMTQINGMEELIRTHMPAELFDSNGVLRQETTPSFFTLFLNDVTKKIVSNLCDDDDYNLTLVVNDLREVLIKAFNGDLGIKDIPDYLSYNSLEFLEELSKQLSNEFNVDISFNAEIAKFESALFNKALSGNVIPFLASLIPIAAYATGIIDLVGDVRFETDQLIRDQLEYISGEYSLGTYGDFEYHAFGSYQKWLEHSIYVWDTRYIYVNDPVEEIKGTDYNDCIYIGLRSDEVHGGTGDDVITCYHLVTANFHGGAGDDFLVGGSNNDELYGDEGNDRIWGNNGNDRIFGGTGNDTLLGASDIYGSGDNSNNQNFIVGGKGNDTIYGGICQDIIYGDDDSFSMITDGSDIIYGLGGDDTIYGGGGNDIIDGGSGNDWIYGYEGNDTIIAGSGTDHVWGDAGDDEIHGSSGHNYLFGGKDNDVITGGIGTDNIWGGDDNDTLDGSFGNDSIYGGNGSDTLDGGYGTDYLYGGNDGDTYIVTKDRNQNYIFDTYGNNFIYCKDIILDELDFVLSNTIEGALDIKIKDTNDVFTIMKFNESYERYYLEFDDVSERYVFVVNEDVVEVEIDKDSINSSFGDSNYDSIWGKVHNSSKNLQAKKYREAEKTQPPRDPLVIDLSDNGASNDDGLVNVDNGVYFDLDNNGFAEKTAWIHNGKGFLAYDRNENDIIDNGSELFGDSVIMSNGQKSTHGFEALADLDSNHDGIIDENDIEFNKLLVWQDTVRNGKTDAGELKTLEELGIKSISLTTENKNHKTESGTIITDSAEVQFTDNRITEIAEHWFEAHSFDSQELNIEGDGVSLTSFGNMPSLSNALAADESGKLNLLVEAFRETDDFAEKRIITKKILYFITGADEILSNSRGGSVDARDLHVIEAVMGVESFIGADGSTTPNSNAAPILKELYVQFENLYLSLLDNELDGNGYIEYLEEKVDENGNIIIDQEYIDITIENAAMQGYNVESMIFSIGSYLKTYDRACGTNCFDAFKERYSEYAETLETITNADSVLGTNENDSINGTNASEIFWGDSGSDTINAGNGNDFIYGGTGDDTMNGGDGNDSYYIDANHGNDVIRDTKGDNKIYFTDGLSVENYEASINAKLGFVLTNKETGETVSLPDFLTNPLNYNFNFEGGSNTEESITNREVFEGTAAGDYIETGDGFNISYGGDGDDTLAGGKDIDFMYGGNGDDLLLGRNGVNVLFGEEGNDTIYDGDHGSYLNGGNGDDMLYGGGGADVLDGGAGNDYLQGDHGNDTYIFGKGYDTDTINASSDVNTIIIKGYSASSMINTRNAHNDLIIHFDSEDSTDCLIIDHFFDYNSNRDINFEFDNGTVLGQYDIKAKYAPIEGTENSDWLGIQTNEDIIYRGYDGHDGIGAGNGNDTLDGGTGNDVLNGGNGTDTYIFAKGYGNDSINEWGTDKSIVKFTDINSDEVTIVDQWGNLLVTVNDTEDTLTINSFKWGQSTYSFEFADGAIASVNKDTFELEFSKLPDIPEVSEDEIAQSNAELLTEIYAEGSVSAELISETDTTVISEVTESTTVADETDEISDQTDIQVMILTENMSAFADEANVYDTANITDTTTDTALNQLLVNSAV